MPSLFYIGYDVKREERYFPPFELVRRLAKPPDSGWRQMIRGEASIICNVLHHPTHHAWIHSWSCWGCWFWFVGYDCFGCQDQTRYGSGVLKG